MKKLIVIALAVVMTFAVVAFAACGGTETVEGECSYGVKYGETPSMYGCKVKVTVKGGVITKVELVDFADWTRTTSTWTESEDKKAGDDGYQLGYTKTEAAYADYLKKFQGKTVEEVKAIKITMISGNENLPAASYTVTVENKADWSITGATQSSARIIAAVQNALSKLGK